MAFSDQLAACAQKVDALLARLLDGADAAVPGLHDAMRYAALGPGKRLRPYLLIETAAMLNKRGDGVMRAAAALECVHCYSLIHDDLPAMDDDDLRRGRPTLHIAFNEATAILAGDALLTKAFEILIDPATHDNAQIRADLVAGLARAAGAQGMVAGQMRDLEAEHAAFDIGQITAMQRLKTGALIEYACWAGGTLAGADKPALDALGAYAGNIGLAFQIIDDLLDTNSSATKLGKRTGKDAGAGKATFVSLLGQENAAQKAQDLIEQAISQLDRFGPAAENLIEAARFTGTRRN
jgi:farnesyl diphosphate synthase